MNERINQTVKKVSEASGSESRKLIMESDYVKFSEQINKSIKQTLEKFQIILEHIPSVELDSYDDQFQVMSAWADKEIFISKSYLLLFKYMISNIEDVVRIDFKFDEDVEKLVDSVLSEMGEVDISQMGKVIGAVMAKGDGLDGGTVSKIVKQKLS